MYFTYKADSALDVLSSQVLIWFVRKMYFFEAVRTDVPNAFMCLYLFLNRFLILGFYGKDQNIYFYAIWFHSFFSFL